MGRMKAKGEVRVLEIDQHAIVTWLDRLRYKLSVVHFKDRLLLKEIKFSVVRTQAVVFILLGYGKNRGFEIPKRETLSPSDDLMLPTSFVV